MLCIQNCFNFIMALVIFKGGNSKDFFRCFYPFLYATDNLVFNFFLSPIFSKNATVSSNIKRPFVTHLALVSSLLKTATVNA